MTPEQYEKAARHLCKLRGIDPDMRVGHGVKDSAHGWEPDILVYSPAWELVADEIKAYIQVQEAIAVATEPYAKLASELNNDRIQVDPVTGDISLGRKP